MKRTPSLLTAGLFLSLLSMEAAALALSATTNWTLNGAPGTPGTDSATAPPGTYADIIGSDSSGVHNVFYHVGGNDLGSYASRVSGAGVFDITGNWNSTFTFTNTSASAANVTYTVYIENGELTVQRPVTPLGGAGNFGTAEYVMILSKDGVEFARSGMHLLVGNDNTTTLTPYAGAGAFSVGGTYNASIASYYWGATSSSFNLGSVAGGASFDIDVSVMTRAALNSLNDTCSGGGVNGGVNVTDAAGIGEPGSGAHACGATARFGDPPGLEFDPLNNNNPGGGGSVTIPEPGTLALLGLGLLGVTALRRRAG